MNIWNIWYGSRCYTLKAMSILDLLEKVKTQSWDQDISFITKIELIGYE